MIFSHKDKIYTCFYLFESIYRPSYTYIYTHTFHSNGHGYTLANVIQIIGWVQMSIIWKPLRLLGLPIVVREFAQRCLKDWAKWTLDVETLQVRTLTASCIRCIYIYIYRPATYAWGARWRVQARRYTCTSCMLDVDFPQVKNVCCRLWFCDVPPL